MQAALQMHRMQLESLAAASCSEMGLTIFPRPGQPFFASVQPAAILVVFPLWCSKTSDNDLIRTAFVQV